MLKGLRLLSRGALLISLAAFSGGRLPFLRLGFSQSSIRRRSFESSLLLSLCELLLSVLLPRTGGLLLSVLLPRIGGLSSLYFLRVLRLLARSLEPRILLLPTSELYESADEKESLLLFLSESVSRCRGGDCDTLAGMDMPVSLLGGECDRLA